MKATAHRSGTAPALRGYQIVSMEEGSVSIYGDSEGLRSLAQVLMFVADLDQMTLKNGQPVEDSFHCHIAPGRHLLLPSLPVIIGRVDTAAGRFRDEIFPLPKRKRKACRR